jgi:hypothetical protein
MAAPRQHNDKIWAAYIEQLEDAISKKDWFTAASIYSDMALYMQSSTEP